MNSDERKKHWENVFLTKDTTKVSWYQKNPETTIHLISGLNLSKSDKIIEVGCGDSFVADDLLDLGYKDITLLDISEKALLTIQKRLKGNSKYLNFVCTDITLFETKEKFKLWHDRAVFHFLTEKEDIEKYQRLVAKYLPPGSYFIVGTFSKSGPKMCSALHVKQYSEQSLIDLFKHNFKKVNCFEEDHVTPSNTIQKFQYCIFKRKP